MRLAYDFKTTSSEIFLTFAVMNMMVIVAVNVSQVRSGTLAYGEVLETMTEQSWKLQR